VGDWDGDGDDTVGLYVPGQSVFYLRNSNTSGYADETVLYGAGGLGWQPVVGDWNGVSGSPLKAAAGPGPGDAGTAVLSERDLQPIVAQAIADWVPRISADQSKSLASVNVVVTDLPGSHLGLARRETVYLDRDAAGHGWFVDTTPNQNEEYRSIGSGGALRAFDPRAVDRIDLLTVVEHELGHVLGFEDLDASTDRLMAGLLEAGVRRLGPAPCLRVSN
jgi:hypothetical protein